LASKLGDASSSRAPIGVSYDVLMLRSVEKDFLLCDVLCKRPRAACRSSGQRLIKLKFTVEVGIVRWRGLVGGIWYQ